MWGGHKKTFPGRGTKIRFSARVLQPRNIWYVFLHKIDLQSFISNSAKFGIAGRFNNEVIRFQMQQVSEKCLPLPTDHFFFLSNTHGRGESLKANMDSKSECQLFLPEKKSVLTEFAPMLRYEIDISFERTLLPVFPHKVKISIPGKSNNRI